MADIVLAGLLGISPETEDKDSNPSHSSEDKPEEEEPENNEGNKSEDQGKSSDSEVMKGLNARFAKYINKIRSLENKNRTLQVEIEQVRTEEKTKSVQSEERSSKLNGQIQILKREKSELVKENNSLSESLMKEQQQRKEAEEKLKDLQDEKESEIQNLELKISTLSTQITEKKTEVETMKIQLTSSPRDELDGINLEDILKTVREEAQKVAGSHNDVELEKKYEVKIKEQEERYQKEISDLERNMESLKSKIKIKDKDFKCYLKKYENLQSNEISLKAEIIAYRTLLELEEKRVNPKDHS